jgi:DNA-binding beta-propeller fold protein YncE
MNRFSILICIFLIAHLICVSQTTKSNYKIVNRFSVEGDGSWDYISIDENTGRLFISHGLVTQVIDSKSGKLLGTIQDTKGVHGIAIASELNKAFISCGRDSSISIINLKSLELISKIKSTGAGPDAILFDPFSKNVFVFNARSSNAAVIDGKTNKIITTIPLPGNPEFSVSDEKGKVYVNIEDKSLIVEINSSTLKIENSWSVSPGEEPSGLALDNSRHRLFSVCDNKKMIVMDAQNGKVISTLEIGGRVDGCGFDPELNRAYSSNGEGTVTVVQGNSGDNFSVLENIPTQKGARTMCIDRKTHHLYLPTAEYGDTPAATNDNPHPRPSIKPGTFVVLDIESEK